MSCEPKEAYVQENDTKVAYKQEYSTPKQVSMSAKWREIGLKSVIAVCLLVCIVLVQESRYWGMGERSASKRNWEQMSGNDGKFWKGTPNEGIYADSESVRCYSYYQYCYDSQGRLSKVKTFRPHDYYEDVWCLADEEIYKYDRKGRIAGRSDASGSEQWVYEYTEEGHTETYSSNYMAEGLIYAYDLAGNLIYYKNAQNYRYARGITYEYDDKNRKVREMMEVEGKSPYGTPPCVVLSIEYDEENHTAVETEYNWDGEITYVWHSTYDEEWRKTGSSWYAVEDIPEGYSAEECTDYYTQGYLASYSGGLLMEEIRNNTETTTEKTRSEGNYYACDYDSSGNCIWELEVYRYNIVGLERYVYDEEGRLTEQYSYDLDDVVFWEQELSDGGRLTLQNSGGELLSIKRSSSDGTLVNEFIYEEDIEVQYTPTATIYWQNSPSLMLAQKQQEPGTGSDADKQAQPDIEQPESGFPETEQPENGFPETELPAKPAAFFYTVQEGECLWRLAEEFMGDGFQYRKIYLQNRDIIGDNPSLLLPGTRLYIEPD